MMSCGFLSHENIFGAWGEIQKTGVKMMFVGEQFTRITGRLMNGG